MNEQFKQAVQFVKAGIDVAISKGAFDNSEQVVNLSNAINFIVNHVTEISEKKEVPEKKK